MLIFFNVIICLVIIVMGMFVAFTLYRIDKKFERIYSCFEEEIITKQIEYVEKVDANDVSVSDYREKKYDRGRLNDNRDKYYKSYAEYVALSQMISLFPLMGIFGTVFGLTFASMTDMNQLTTGLGTALWTTIFGMVFSISLKFYDANFPGKKVNLIDAEFEKAEMIVQHQIMKEEIYNSIRGDIKK